jgi:hypothetical protein
MPQMWLSVVFISIVLLWIDHFWNRHPNLNLSLVTNSDLISVVESSPTSANPSLDLCLRLLTSPVPQIRLCERVTPPIPARWTFHGSPPVKKGRRRESWSQMTFRWLHNFGHRHRCVPSKLMLHGNKPTTIFFHLLQNAHHNQNQANLKIIGWHR